VRFISSFALYLRKHRGLQVVLLLTLYLLLKNFLPLFVHQGFYTLSLLIKDLLIWILPLTVGFFIADTICRFEHKAPLFICCLLLFEALSNLACVWYAYSGGQLVAESLPLLQTAKIHDEFSALWRLPLTRPSWWTADKGTFAGLLFGFWGAMSKRVGLRQTLHKGKEWAQWMLTRFFSRLIPLFVLGFVARMSQTKLLNQIVSHYGELLLWLILFLTLYLLFLFFVSAGFSFSNLLRPIKNLLPAGSLAFTSGCSLSTMPWTIEGTKKNLKNPPFAEAVIPATTNIQQVGDCIANAFLCFLIYRHFLGQSPDAFTWLNFSLIFVLARFATAAVIGGSIFIMLPIYETYLSFNAEMITIILAFNVLLDPIITSCNVMGNGALCGIFERVWSFFSFRKEAPPLEEKKDAPINSK
jgi:hypothetical protein